MIRRSKDTLVLDKPKQIAAVTSPARTELLECFAEAPALSVADLAERLGKSVGSVYYHVRMLVDVGVLGQVGERKSGKKDEALYGMACKKIVIGPSPTSKKGVEAAQKATASILRATTRELTDAIASSAVRREGVDREIYAMRGKARLTKAELRRINEHVEAITEILQQARRTRRSGRAYSFLAALAPARVSKKGDDR